LLVVCLFFALIAYNWWEIEISNMIYILWFIYTY
jgi:hypothetical protein